MWQRKLWWMFILGMTGFLVACSMPSLPSNSACAPNTDKYTRAGNIPSGNYKLRWVNQDPGGGKSITLNGDEVCTWIDFASVGDPIPQDATLVLYLHKDRSMGNPDAAAANAGNPTSWTSTPGIASDPYHSRFETSLWGKGLDAAVQMAGVLNAENLDDYSAVPYLAYPVSGAVEPSGTTPEGYPVYRFYVSFNGKIPCEEWRSPDARRNPLECREDFGVAFWGTNQWLPADKGDGGRLRSDNDLTGMGAANAWFRIKTGNTSGPVNLVVNGDFKQPWTTGWTQLGNPSVKIEHPNSNNKMWMSVQETAADRWISGACQSINVDTLHGLRFEANIFLQVSDATGVIDSLLKQSWSAGVLYLQFYNQQGTEVGSLWWYATRRDDMNPVELVPGYNQGTMYAEQLNAFSQGMAPIPIQIDVLDYAKNKITHANLDLVSRVNICLGAASQQDMFSSHYPGDAWGTDFKLYYKNP